MNRSASAQERNRSGALAAFGGHVKGGVDR